MKTRITNEKLPEYIVNAMIEHYEMQCEEDGIEPQPNKEADFDLDYVLKALIAKWKGDNYRANRNRSANGLMKQLKRVDDETRDHIMKQLGLKK
jgi:hypothetical protein